MASYSDVTVSGYDSSPPSDDATESEANRIKWSTIKTKLGDPLNTAVGSVDDNIAAAITTITSNLSTSASNAASTSSTYTSVSGNMYAPATTAVVFAQSAAPTGWTKAATDNNKALRLISGGTGGSAGGTTAFTSVLAATTITSSNMPAHDHSWSDSATVGAGINMSKTSYFTSVSLSGGNDLEAGGTSCVEEISVSEEAMTGTVSISGTTDASGSGTAMDFAVRYMDVIIATKDA